MWGFVLLLGLWMTLDWVRVAIVVLLASRPRPVINLLAFWVGAMVTGVGSAFAALILLRDFLPALAQDVMSTVAGFTGGHTKIVIGVLALLTAAVNAVGLARQRASVPVGSLAPQPSMPSAVSRLVAFARPRLDGRMWVAFVLGLGQAPPIVEYMAAIYVIEASGAGIGTQLCAAVAFTVAMLTIVEIPLVLYLVQPAHTEAIALSMRNWLAAHRRQIFVVGTGVLGIVMLASA